MGKRIPAGNLEGLVINRLRTFLADPGAIFDAVDNESHNGSGCSQLIERGRSRKNAEPTHQTKSAISTPTVAWSLSSVCFRLCHIAE
jgi:hypothetical protein